MPTVSFTSALQRFLAAPSVQVEAATVADALAAVFTANPLLRGYVLDDQGGVRRHVNIFINSQPIDDRIRLTDPVGANDDIYVLQALTGG